MKKILLAAIFLLTACSSSEVVITMDNIDDYLMLEEYQYVDVREIYEAEATGIIKGFEMIPTSELEETNYNFQAFSSDKKILVMCRSGRRAGVIVDLLIDAGYDAYNIGGIIDYDGTNLESVQ